MPDKKKPAAPKVTTRVVAQATPKKQSTKKTASKAEPKATAVKAKKVKTEKKPRDNYFIGAWRELKQVRWPDRKSTWGMTFGVVFYSLFFFVLVIVLDAIFKYLFDLLVKG